MYETQSKYSEGLHVLRGLAAVSVVFFHSAHMAPVADVGVLKIVNEFGSGVTLFFILSGFSLTLSNAGQTEQPGWIRSYAIKRFFRIAPLWYFMVAVSGVYQYFEYGAPFKAGPLSWHILPIFGFIPGEHASRVWAGWTIGVEVIFYTIFPLLLATLRLNILGWTILTLLAIMASIDFPARIKPDFAPGYEYMGFARQFAVFCVGSLLCVLMLRTPPEWLGKLRTGAALAVLVALAWWTAHHYSPRTAPLGDAVIFKAVALGVITLAFSAPRSILYNPLTKLWGDASYGIYLMHPIFALELKPAQAFLSETVPNTELAFLLYAGCVLIIVTLTAWGVHTLIESPFFRYGHALARDAKARLVDFMPVWPWRVSPKTQNPL